MKEHWHKPLDLNVKNLVKSPDFNLDCLIGKADLNHLKLSFIASVNRMIVTHRSHWV